MRKAFDTVGIIGRVRTQGVKETLSALISFLSSMQQAFVIEAETAESLEDVYAPIVTREELGSHCDLVIVVGGDGSLLNATHAVVNHDIPVLGINRGSLGFLTDILPSELEKIQAILEGAYTLEKRFLLTAKLEIDGKVESEMDALNEVAMIPDIVPHMLEFEIYINDQFVCSQNSDGLIIATPTGSTAYALSGGGPILHPQLDAIVLVPMFPHTLSSRPVVVEGNSTIKLVVSPKNAASPRINCDGQPFGSAPPNSHIIIEKKPQALFLVHPLDYHYFETLRSKLHWGKELNYTH